VFGIAVGDDHRPDRNWKKVSGTISQEIVPDTFFGARPTWLLGRPQRLVTQNDAPTYQGELALVAGPERIESGWWDGAEVRRDYYLAANARGETYWIFREHRGDQGWYMHGVFA
jgi:protein ImuB